MEVTGRIIADALRKIVSNEREVVQFSIAINDTYKPKGATETKKTTTFIDCSYWINPGIATYLKKGTIVTIAGNISARAYKNMDGEPKASLNFHVNTIKLYGGGKQAKNNVEKQSEKQTDDLPF